MAIAKIGFGFGHTLSGKGSRTTTAKGYSINESQANRIVGELVIKYLKYGFEVIVARQDAPNVNEGDDLRYRVSLMNKEKVDTYWEQHFNGYNGTATGTVTLRYPGTHSNGLRSIQMAEIMQKELVSMLKLRDRGISDRDDLYVLKNTMMPAVIIEPLFIDNSQDMRKFDAEKIAYAEASAIYKAYGYNLVDYLPKVVDDVVLSGGEFFRVVAGSYSKRENAYDMQAKLMAAGFESFLVSYKSENHNNSLDE